MFSWALVPSFSRTHRRLSSGTSYISSLDISFSLLSQFSGFHGSFGKYSFLCFCFKCSSHSSSRHTIQCVHPQVINTGFSSTSTLAIGPKTVSYQSLSSSVVTSFCSVSCSLMGVSGASGGSSSYPEILRFGFSTVSESSLLGSWFPLYILLFSHHFCLSF